MLAVPSFTIDQWCAWAPGLERLEDWLGWSRQPFHPAPSDAQPDVSFLPAMQRRRLSRLARMAFHVAWPLADGHAQLPLIFVSRHGETPRTYGLLSELAADQPLSPTHFSLSVHNAIIGQWSILRGDHSEMTALAGERDGFEHAVLEAALLLAEGAPAVLVVIAEEQPPHVYSPWIDDVPFPYAAALLLTPGSQWHLQQQSPQDTPQPCAWPHALSLLHTLLSGQGCCTHSWKNRQWSWQRQS